MPSTLPRSVRDALGEQAAEDFASWFDQSIQQRTVHRDEFREVLSRLDVIEERFGHVEGRLERMEVRFEKIDEKLDRMNGRILSMTRWLIGLLIFFGTMVTALLAVAQFTT